MRNTWFVKFQHKNWEGERKWVTRMESSGILFDSFIEIYKRDRLPRIKESTFLTKESIIDSKILQFFGKKPLREISTLDIMRW